MKLCAKKKRTLIKCGTPVPPCDPQCGGNRVKKKKFLNRHTVLLVIYALLLMEAVYRIAVAGGTIRSLWVEGLTGAGIAAAYLLAVHIYENWRTHSEFRVLVNRIHCGIAIIRMDDEFSLLRANPAFFRINGYTPDEFLEKFGNKTIHLLCKEDRAAVYREIKKLDMEQVHVHVDFRIQSKDRRIKWIHMDSFLFYAAGEEPVFQCIFTDITALRSSMERAEMEAKRYHIIAQLSDDILFEYDFASRTMTATQPISDLYDGKTSIPDFYNDVVANLVVHQDDVSALADFDSEAGGKPEKIRSELRIRSANDAFAWYRMEGAVLRDKDEKPLKIVGKFTNIDRQKREKEYLTQKLQRDPMTGVFNKVVTEKLIDRYLHEADHDDVSALFVMDLDNFKSINDALGHLSGDRVLTHITQEIKQILRSSDIFGRIGGDEFVVFIKNIRSYTFAAQKARQLCRIFRSPDLEQELHYAVSGSVGIAMSPGDGASYHELFEKADRALYTAKGKGKDGFAFYRDSLPGEECAAGSEPCEEPLLPRCPSQALAGRGGILENLLAFVNGHCLDHNATEQMLGLVCRYYQVKRGRVLEFSEDGEKIGHVYEWHAPGLSSNGYRLLSYPPAFWEAYLQQFDQASVFQCASLHEAGITPGGERDLLSLQHLLVSRGQPASILMLDNDIPQNQLTFYELNILEIVHNLLQHHLYLLQNLRVSQELVNIDSLTGVHTYEYFHTLLKRALTASPEIPYVLISCDINRFSEINDLIGHDQADQVLVTFASVIRSGLQPDEYIGRVSVDIFCILAHAANKEELLVRMELWDRMFQKEVAAFRIPSNVQVAVGIYRINAGADTPSIMFDRANAARKLAKAAHERMVCFYDEKLHEKILFEKDMESHMVSSLEKNEFVIYLQPKYGLVDRKIAGAEALVRWNHPTRGFIGPNEFIPLFEKNHFILELDFFVFESVCRMLRRWMDEGRPVVPIAANFSRVHLLTNDFVERLVALAERYQIPTYYLEIELTESAYISRFHNALQIAQRLRQYGFLMAMDDFGAGYSSLNSLKSLPLDILKLDKNFFQEKEPTPKETIIIENIVRLAKQLNLCVVSEGVELEWQAEFLCSVDCDLVQGYLFSRPIPVPTFEKILMEHAQPLLHYPPER